MGNIEEIKPRVIPIIVYGNPVLRRKTIDVIHKNNRNSQFLSDLWYTLEISGGVGLAAPQVNNSQSRFVVNSTLMYNDLGQEQRKQYFVGDNGIEETFINPNIITVSEEKNTLTEGCLSIPEITEFVERPWEIIIEYFDKNFVFHRKQFSGYTARVIQHEYDHLQGKLFIDHLSSLRKKLIKSKLKKISEGKINTNYSITI